MVRLWPDEEVTSGLCVAEGVETALTAARGFGLAWACLDAANLAALPVLPGVEALTIVADHDEAGIRAADACAPALARGRPRGAGVEGAGRGRRLQRLRPGGRGMKTAEDIRRELDGGPNVTVLRPKADGRAGRRRRQDAGSKTVWADDIKLDLGQARPGRRPARQPPA